MKNNAIARIVMYSIVIILLLGILITVLSMDQFSFLIGAGDALDHELSEGVTNFDAQRVSKIEIDWAAGFINLMAGEPQGSEGDISIMPSSADDEYPITYEIDGDTLKISYTNASVGIQFGSIPQKDLIIWVPENWLCKNLDVDGAALDLTVENVNIGSLDVDGADCNVTLNGSVETVECDGADCDLDLRCDTVPSSIDLDGVACVLELTLPEDCGFLVRIDGLDCSFNSALPYTNENGDYLYGDRQCRISADGLSCEITINTLG